MSRAVRPYTSKPEILNAGQAAAVAGAKAIVDRMFKEVKRAVAGAVLAAYMDAKRDGTSYEVDAIVRDTAQRVA